ncbi:hypothetical protein CHLRE_15g643703v5 [Chlamydomonas reinhardtii]|uniref:RRM domain-containing protein n=1 Tax=Chlamydomonas reinhardtii TaxID=3055 RepID=A0A2K3CX03_CHLRE|nr:uncharacterized protein CHLRE_15g643703v5 [Chlamydomonas reinhardtii]PNW72800.1 hypothetical protein CHLRE_15g643703v5 [Chlamydomonas reinhardtii]
MFPTPAAAPAYSGEQPLGVYAVLPAAGVALSPTGEEIRTIFVTGFPANVHERELHNLVCFLPGYEASQMNLKSTAAGTSPQGFALFATPAAAQSAMLLLHDMPFDVDCHLRCEMAHKNMYLKSDDPTIRRADVSRGQGGPVGAAGSGVMAGGAGMAPMASMSGGMGGMGGPAMAVAARPQPAATLVATMGPHAGMPAYTAMAPHAAFTTGPLLASTLAALRPAGHAVHHHGGGGGGATLLPPPGQASAMAASHAGLINPTPVAGFGPVTNKFDNPPCNTLFIGNLGDTVDEGELTALFACQPGYKQLKLLRHPRQVSCFVEFGDVNSAAAVHSALQGALLTSSDRGPIRIQFSKNPYGKRNPQMGGMGYGMGMGMGGSLSASSASSSAALFGAAAAAAVGGGGGVITMGHMHHGGGGGMGGSAMANAIMAAGGGGGSGEFGGWSQQFTGGLMG